ncbi:MAG: hypothetical protein ACYCOO_05480, partial [Chitinophagaceae bacterium]
VSGKQAPAQDISFAIKSSFLKSMLDSLPDDFHGNNILSSRASSLAHLDRVDQIRKIEDYVFMVKVYN